VITFIIFEDFTTISYVSFDVKPDVSEISVSIIRIHMVSDHCPVGASSDWCTVHEEGGVELCGHPSYSEPIPMLHNLVSLVLFCFVFSIEEGVEAQHRPTMARQHTSQEYQ
jgi:hypothetical protein